MTQIIQNGPGIQYYYPDAQNNDGRITRQVVNGVEKAYTYDSLGRLSTAGSASYTYDGFGNRLQQTSPAMYLTYNASNNRITTTGYSYDNNGNLTAMPNLTMSYDVENRLAQAQTPTVTENYRYAPSGQRVSKQKSGSYAWYFYGVDGRLIGTYVPCQYYGTLFQVQSTNVYFGGRTLQAQNVTGIKQDRLGTTSYTTTTYAPYGDTGISPPPYGDGLGFTGHYRDGSTTGLDYAQQRYYAPSIGRFTTADPYLPSAAIARPQSWNRYAYVENDPVNKVDPSGLDACSAEYGYGFSAACDYVTGLPSDDPGGQCYAWADQLGISAFSWLATTGQCGPMMTAGSALSVYALMAMANARVDGDPQPKRVSSLRIESDCWSNEPSPKTLAPYRKTTYVAYDGETSLKGDPDIVIQEAVTDRKHVLAKDYIDTPDSKGTHGVFNDEKGLPFTTSGPWDLLQTFQVSIAGGTFFPVYVETPIGPRGTLGLYMVDQDVFVEGVGKAGIPICK